MNKTATGVNFLNLSEAGMDMRELILDAERCYPTFNFRYKLETVIFYTERSDFRNFVLSEYGIQDKYSHGEKAVHYPVGDKFVIGVAVYQGLTKSLLIREMGYAVEDYRLKMESGQYEKWKDRDGYRYWTEFFCQAHASFERKPNVHENDLYLNELPFSLEDRNEMFNEANIDRTYRKLILSMSDLYYYYEKKQDLIMQHYLTIYEKMTHPPFMELYDELFNYLVDYFRKYGMDYSKPHHYRFFEVLEDYKEEFTDYFLKRQL